MSQNIVKIFKLNFDGSFDEIAYENIKEVFTIVNILAIYITSKKIMYIWIGHNATQALKNHISNIRVLVKEEFPDFRIIRNFTFEMREEPFDFFQNLDLSKEELYKLIDYQEKVMLPTLRKIERLKIAETRLIDSEDYPNAIKNSEEIIKLAAEINDEALLTEQKRLITELKTKSANKALIDKIEEEAEQVNQQFSNLIATKEFLKAHSIVEEFEKKNSKIYDLSVIPSARELISKEKKIWKREQERLIKELTKLKNDFFLAIKNLEIEKAINIVEKGKSHFSNLINDEVKKKWEHFEDDLQEAKKRAELVKNIDVFIVESEEMKKNYQFNAIKKEINDLSTKVQKLDLNNYQKKLEDLKAKTLSAEEDYIKKIAEIDNLEKLINKNQGSNLIDDVLRDCQKIIQIAQTLNKSTTIEKYSAILEQTEKAIEERKIFEENQNKLKQKLSTLENTLKIALKNMNITEATEILGKGKILLEDIIDNAIKEQWNGFESNFVKTKKKKELLEAIDKFLEESLELKENFLFEDLELKINNFMSQVRELTIPKYLIKLEALKLDVDSIKEQYNKLNKEIESLENDIKEGQKDNLLEDILKHCKQIIELAKKNKNSDLLKKYSLVLKQTEKSIEERRVFEEKQKKLVLELKQLEGKLNSSLKVLDISKLEKIVEKSKILLIELVNEEITENWVILEKSYNSARELLENVEKLGEQGLNALDDRAYRGSLRCYEQIINQLIIYSK